MPICYIGLGSNIGDRQKNIQQAIQKISALKSTVLIKASSFIETKPVGGPEQNDFINAAIEIKTDLSPHELLSRLQEIESQLGRVRTVKNGPRSIDLDILIFDEQKITEADLVLPHPRIKEREFVLRPLREIAPHLVESLVHEDSQKN